VNIYVGNLSFNTTEFDIRSMFEAFGEVESANLIIDRTTGRSKGFAFVEMPQQSQAQAAIAELNGSTQGGRPLTVNEARPKADRPRRDRW
jgi:RNA recognition motif-containing protein